jgi:hypothetical protein
MNPQSPVGQVQQTGTGGARAGMGNKTFSKRFSVVAAEGNPLNKKAVSAGLKLGSAKPQHLNVDHIADARQITAAELQETLQLINSYE